ncbi:MULTISPECIES: proline dehydrogenase family protein [unclassified Bacillus (in: firmicutes)]|uniref:proline dehydrogenase family protein n=1 Tax=unclassified Bacillus (in: firmicutes) TaxID=185979 RepID=UPI001BECF296|nr:MULTISPECIES: proline dehydrogenase [unclassified Bacillus (in: firmicutes)]MBT2720270.1 proline dehydrogenase [Bacillus sp. ISL-46]MBT2739136.1 proline dehydrogenase [Bacillus sp. ISL-77]
MELLMRNMFQSLGKNTSANKLAKKYGLRFGAGRFVAGESIQTAIDSVKKLNRDGKMVTLDHLGEFVYTEEEAQESTAMCVQTLDAIAEAGVNSNLSLKMTSLGLDISRELCMKNMRKILNRAKLHQNFVRIDMEDYDHCQVSLDIYKELRKEYDNVGLVIQAYLFRTEQDIADLNQLNANLRLVKGAYKESPTVAFPEKKDVDENFKKIIKQHLLNGNYTAVATHDEAMIEYTKTIVSEHRIAKEQFEFQMLYGICEDIQAKLVKEGFNVRVYVPYGVDWFGYFMRRLAERPANVWFVLKNLLK